jgi:hypothetical protein
MRRNSKAAAASIAVFAASLCGPAAQAGAAGAPGAGPAALALAVPPRDTIIGHRGAVAAAEATKAQAGSGSFSTGDGQTIRVGWAAPYNAADAQGVATYLGTLLHGHEIARLSVYLATAAQIHDICGAGALSCYDPAAEQMVIAGDDGASGGVSRAFVIAHEYGHHIANHRRNRPWWALRWGPKRWATQEGVCPGVRAGRYDPWYGYWNNPGEAWAESFAFYHYPAETAWMWTLPHPNAATYRAVRRDVLRPWRKNTKQSFTGRLGGGSRADSHLVRTPLDGRIRVALRGPAGAGFDLRVLSRRHHRILARSLDPGDRDSLKYEICGRRSVRVVVHRASGGGRYQLTVSRP